MEDDPPMFERNGMKFPEALRGLIENLPLLEGENPDHFFSLLKAVVADQKPEGIMDWINAIETANKYWEELRLRCASAALVQCNMFNAVNYFLNEIQPMFPDPHGSGGYCMPRFNRKLALDYYSEEPGIKKKARARLEQRGITLRELQTKAMQLSSEPLQMFEKMIASRQNERRRLRKETARSNKNRDKD